MPWGALAMTWQCLGNALALPGQCHGISMLKLRQRFDRTLTQFGTNLTSNASIRLHVAWCILEIVTAHLNGVQIVPVEIQRPGMSYPYPEEEFYNSLRQGGVI